MIKQDIVQQVMERTGFARAKADRVVDRVFERLKSTIAEGARIELRGFGVFTVRPRKTGVGRNPRTGLEVGISPGRAVRFKPGKDLQVLDENTPPVAREVKKVLGSEPALEGAGRSSQAKVSQ